ncbi:MAG TPA: hypothetical protein VGH29_13390 [Candidatus Binataceae bacterium]
MKLTRVWISAAAFAVAFGAAANAWPQSVSESDTTSTTAPAAPSVSSETVTRKVVNPPPVVVNPPAETDTTTTTRSENMVPDRPAPSVEEKKESNTTFGPLGVSHTEKREKSTDD